MTLPRYQFSVLDAAGNVVSGAHAEVRREVAGQPLAQLFSDRAGATTIGNPIDADANGFVAFYVAAGFYQIRVYTGSSGSPTFEAPLYRYVSIQLGTEQAGRTETESGDVALLVTDSLVLLAPIAPQAREITIPAAATLPVTVMDSSGVWDTYNTTFVVEGNGTINGKASKVGKLENGGFEFIPKGDGDFLARGVG